MGSSRVLGFLAFPVVVNSCWHMLEPRRFRSGEVTLQLLAKLSFFDVMNAMIVGGKGAMANFIQVHWLETSPKRGPLLAQRSNQIGTHSGDTRIAADCVGFQSCVAQVGCALQTRSLLEFAWSGKHRNVRSGINHRTGTSVACVKDLRGAVPEITAGGWYRNASSATPAIGESR